MPRKVREDAEKAITITTVVRNSAVSSIQKKRRATQRGSSAIRRQRPSVKAGNNSKNSAALQQVLPDTDDAFAGSDTPMSPAGLATELPQDLALTYYICHLRIKAQERCTIVTSNEQGAQCVAVASPKPGCYNTLLVCQHIRFTSHLAVDWHLTTWGWCCKDKAMEHVLCMPMAFSDSNTGSLSRHMVYICSCQEMQSTAAQVLSLGIEAKHSYEGKPPGLDTTAAAAGKVLCCRLAPYNLSDQDIATALQSSSHILNLVYMPRRLASLAQRSGGLMQWLMVTCMLMQTRSCLMSVRL